MRPVLFNVGPLAIHSWGVMAIAATTAGWGVLRHDLRRQTGDGDAAFALSIAAVAGGIIGARLYYLAEHLGSDSVGLSLSGIGFTWYGGVIGGVIAVLVVARRRGVPTRPLLGSFALALPLAYGIARIGCQLAGDGTYGVASNLPWAMRYPHGVVPTFQRVHPTPVYETLASLLIFIALWRLRLRLTPLRLFALYLVLSGAERFLVEFVRRNDHVWLGLSQPQLWAAALGAIGAALLLAPKSAETGSVGAEPDPSLMRPAL